jgi:beta-lactamase class D
MRSLVLGWAAVLALGCSAAPPRVRTPSATSPGHVAAPRAAEGAVPVGPKPLPEGVAAFENARVTGTIALWDSQDGVLACSDATRCGAAVSPASTFKIPHSMIALETGVVDGPDTILTWDKQEYWNDAWNQDLSFRDAFRFSCFPCFKKIAQRVGEAGEREWVSKLGYGNRDISSGFDKFWLDGSLRISPAEQVEFLRRFDTGKLPISERTADLVRDIMTVDVTESYVLRGKTGSLLPPEDSQLLAWFVGWLELGERRVYFATLMDGAAPGVDLQSLRRPLTEAVLRAKHLM